METSEKNNLIVGEGVSLTGELEAPGLITLHGTVHGNARGDDIRVGPTGCVKGSVEGRNVDIEGEVSEKVVAKTLALRATAAVHGDVEYETIEIEAGARIDGVLKSSAPVKENDSSEYINAEQLIDRLSTAQSDDIEKDEP